MQHHPRSSSKTVVKIVVAVIVVMIAALVGYSVLLYLAHTVLRLY